MVLVLAQKRAGKVKQQQMQFLHPTGSDCSALVLNARYCPKLAKGMKRGIEVWTSTRFSAVFWSLICSKWARRNVLLCFWRNPNSKHHVLFTSQRSEQEFLLSKYLTEKCWAIKIPTYLRACGVKHAHNVRQLARSPLASMADREKMVCIFSQVQRHWRDYFHEVGSLQVRLFKPILEP